jgi:hypothetical protein
MTMANQTGSLSGTDVTVVVGRSTARLSGGC